MLCACRIQEIGARVNLCVSDPAGIGSGKDPSLFPPMNFTLPPFTKWIDLGAAVLILFVVAVTGPASGAFLPVFGFGLLWIALGWKCRFPLVLTSLLIGAASRFSWSRTLSPQDLWALQLGLAVWVASVWIPSGFRWMGIVLGLVWGALLWVEPGLWLFVLCALPRLVLVNAERGRLLAWTASLSGIACVTLALVSGAAGDLFQRPGESETYTAVSDLLSAMFAQESLLLIVGLVGLFELAQSHGEDHRWGWRNLALLGVLLSLLFLDPSRVLGAGLWIGFPAATILLSRWTLALPHLISRILFWLGFGLLIGVGT